MTPETWRQMEDLYNAARDLPAGERGVLLESVDPQVRAKVEAMLAQSDSMLDHPPWEATSTTATVATSDSQLGPYRIEHPIGRGGMGQVFRAFDTRLGRKVALKLLLSNRTGDPEMQRRFLQEARAASALNHPNIVVVHDIETSAATNYLVMEYVDGKTLKDLIETGGVLPFPRVIEYGAQLASALSAAHSAGIIHRDVKPANIMVTPDHRVKLLDFGIAKLTPLANVGLEGGNNPALFEGTLPGVVMGTVSYMSPEQARGEPADARSDIFSLGCLLYEAATGILPFRGPSALAILHDIATVQPPPPSSLRPGLPSGFDLLGDGIPRGRGAQRP